MENFFLLEPWFVEKVWGGDRLGRLIESGGERKANARYGEAWLLYIRDERSSIVRSGKNKGRSLAEIAKQDGVALLGRRFAGKRFPLLCKFICADSGHLSVQLHPDKEAVERFKERGPPKEEVWYVVEALRLPSLIIGLKGDWRSLDLHEPQTLKASLNYTEASPGEVLKIRAGLLHSLLAGTLVFEVSSNSDITYRLYDWGREGREMHEEKALSSLSTAEMKDVLLRGEVSEGSGVEVTRYVTSICTLEQIDFLRSYRILPTGVFRFGVVIWGTVECEGVRAERGDSFFIPACASSFEMIADEPSRVLLVTP